MARAYYPSGNGYVPWTADMVNGFSLDGLNGVSLTHNTQNEPGYRCVLNYTAAGPWENHQCVYTVASRHSGNGIISFKISTTTTTDITDVDLQYFGVAKEMFEDAWIAIVNGDNVKLYVKMMDYNTTRLACLQRVGFPQMTTDYPWVTELPSGTQYQVNINNSEVIVSSSQPTNPNAKIWVKI